MLRSARMRLGPTVLGRLVGPDADADATLFYAGLLAIGALATWIHPLNPDEGVFLNGAWNLQHGRELYVDFFEFVGPFSFYVIDAVWTVFHPSYHVARALAVVLAGAAALGLVALSRMIDRNRPAYGPATVFFVFLCAGPLVNENLFAVPQLVWATYFAVRGTRRNSALDFLICGLLCGAAVLTVQHKGALLAFGIGSAHFVKLVSCDARSLLRRTSALLIGTLIALCALLRWPFAAIYESLIAFPLNRYMSIQNVGPWELAAAAAFCSWVLAKIRKSMAPGEFLMLAAAQASLIISCVPRPDTMHLVLAMFPVGACYPALAAALRPRPDGANDGHRTSPALLRIKVFVFTLLLFAIPQAPLADRFRQELLGAVEAVCGKDFTLFATPFLPGLYFETGTLNPTAYSVLLEGFNRDEHFKRALTAIEQSPPTCAVVDPTIVRKFGHTGNNPVEMFIRRGYESRTTRQGAEILVWRSPQQ